MSLLPDPRTTFHIMISLCVIACPKQIPIYNNLGKTNNVNYIKKIIQEKDN
jgi:hypothetical protein